MKEHLQCFCQTLPNPDGRWEVPKKDVDKNRVRFPWDFQIQTGRQALANQSDIVVVDKDQNTAVVTDVMVPNHSNISNIRKKEY